MDLAAPMPLPRITPRGWVAYVLLAVLFGPVWDFALSLPISPVSAGIIGGQWFDPRAILFFTGFFSMGSLVVMLALLPWLRRIRSTPQLIWAAVVAEFFLATVFTFELLMPQDLDIRAPLVILSYAAPTALLSAHVAVPLMFAQLWLARRLVGGRVKDSPSPANCRC
jgi:hypothetical protein